jgi:hypothetical protein
VGVASIRNRSFARSQYATVVGRFVPWLERAERLVRPRLLTLSEPTGERLIGLAALLLALLLFAPLPFGNLLPGLALALFGIGLIERDGVAIIAGAIAGLAGFALVSGAAFGLVVAALFMVAAPSACSDPGLLPSRIDHSFAIMGAFRFQASAAPFATAPENLAQLLIWISAPDEKGRL